MKNKNLCIAKEGRIMTTADKIVDLLQSGESINLATYGKTFCEYIQERKQELGIEKPFHLYFVQATMESNGTGKGRVFKGINAMTKEQAPAGISARGGGNGEKEIFVSVDISGGYNEQTEQYGKVLTPIEKRKIIIKLLFTVEHELWHEKQREDVKDPIPTPERIKLAKSLVFIDFWKDAGVFGCANPIVNGREVAPDYMYPNAHEYLFVEQDADAHAYETLAMFLKQNGAAQLLGDLGNYYNTKKPTSNKYFEASFVDYDNNSEKQFFKGTMDELVDYTLNYYNGFSDIAERYPVLKSNLVESASQIRHL